MKLSSQSLTSGLIVIRNDLDALFFLLSFLRFFNVCGVSTVFLPPPGFRLRGVKWLGDGSELMGPLSS